MAKLATLPEIYKDDRVAIDPGAKTCAVAVSYLDGDLVWVGTVDPWAPVRSHGARRVAIELPVANGRSTPPDDLIAEAVAGFYLAGQLSPRTLRVSTPTHWKGQTPKPVHHSRLWAELTADERELLGGGPTVKAILAARTRGARDRWSKPGATYYRASELPTVGGVKITHDILDAAALNLWDSGRLAGP